MLNRLIIVLLVLISKSVSSQGQENTVGLIKSENGLSDGFNLFSPFFQSKTYLINNDGDLVHSWDSDYFPAASVYLAEDGSIYKTGTLPDSETTLTGAGAGGIIEKISWENQIEWSYIYSNDSANQHHDFALLLNGNVLILAWLLRDEEEAIAAGRIPGTLDRGDIWPEEIIEVKPVGANSGEIVWRWNMWDHLIQDFDESKPNFGVISEHPERININFGDASFGDWAHINSIAYNPVTDQIILSALFFNEIWIIDHSTTTEEASGSTGGNSGKGGDLLFRWGNPAAYNQDGPQQIFGSHDVHWVDEGLPNAGKIMFYHNGNDRPDGNYSSIEYLDADPGEDGIYVLNEGTFLPETTDDALRYSNGESFYSSFISGTQQLPNGNILICEGANGNFFEVNQQDEIIWQYISPVDQGVIMHQGATPVNNAVFRVVRYEPSYAAFVDRVLTSQGTIEKSRVLSLLPTSPPNIFPNPSHSYFRIENDGDLNTIEIFSIDGVKQRDFTFSDSYEVHHNLSPGIYLVKAGGKVEKLIVN